MTLNLKTPALAALFALLAAGPALAGASSENEINPKSLEGPGGQDAHSADPGNLIEGSPGPAGPSGTKDLNKGENADGASTGAGSGTSGSSAAPKDAQDGETESQPKSAQ